MNSRVDAAAAAAAAAADEADWRRLADWLDGKRAAWEKSRAWRAWRMPSASDGGSLSDDGAVARGRGADGAHDADDADGVAGPLGKSKAAAGRFRVGSSRSTRTAVLAESLPRAWSREAKKAPDRVRWLSEAAQAAWAPALSRAFRVARYANGWVTVVSANQSLLSEAAQFMAADLARSIQKELESRGHRLVVRGLRFKHGT